ncbi:hypothetical protein Plhal304r1_c019g0067991 [Plasmopara halstedii]
MRVTAAMISLILALAITEASGDVTACNLACAKDERCELETVQCVTTPCDPVPKCVPIKSTSAEAICIKECPSTENCHIDPITQEQLCLSPCATVRCAAGTTCVAKQVQCVRAPCPVIAECKPNK